MEARRRGPGHRESRVRDGKGGTTSGGDVDSTRVEEARLAADTQRGQRD